MFELHRYWWDLHLSGIFIVYKIFPISCSVCFSNWTMGRHLRPGTGANIHKSYSCTRPPTQHHHCCWAAVAVVTTLYSWILIPALEITSPLLNWWHSVRRWLGLWVANSEAQTSDQQKQIEIKSQNTFPKSKIPKVLHWNTLFLRYLFQNLIQVHYKVLLSDWYLHQYVMCALPSGASGSGPACHTVTRVV